MSAPTLAVRHLVYARDGHRCASCGTHYGLQAHHRQATGLGGRKRRPEPHELLTACGPCNTEFEASLQSKALQYGWKVKRHTLEPLTSIPVFYWLEQAWFVLDADGNRTPFEGETKTERNG